MRFGSLDSFVLEDPFWQTKMGKPSANLEFLRALLNFGSFESYHFFCDDSFHLSRFEALVDDLVSTDLRKRVKASLKAHFLDHAGKDSFHVMHHGDFTYYMPYLIELRNRLPASFPVSGVTHSLDGAWMQTRFIQLLLAHPQPFDAIVCTSDCARELLRKAFDNIRQAFEERYGMKLPAPPELARIPLGLPDELFQSRDKLQCRQELEIPPGHFVMLSLARFSPRHKMDLAPMLETIEWLARNHALREFTLVLAGAARPSDIALANSMLAQLGLRERTRLETNISAERKALLYGASDIFLSMVDNYQETFGLTIVEAMAHGLPVVASDFNGYKELVANGRTGFLIPTCTSLTQDPWATIMGLLDPSPLRFYQAQKVSFDVTELAESLKTLASQPDLKAAMGIRGRARALRYRWQAVIPLYEELWRHQRKSAEELSASRPCPAARSGLLTPDVESVFSHYPTRQLSRDDRIQLSEYGRKRREQGFQPILYEEVGVLLDERCREAIVHELGEGERTVGALISEARSKHGFTEEAVVMHLDWLMKHGYASLPREGHDSFAPNQALMMRRGLNMPKRQRERKSNVMQKKPFKFPSSPDDK